MKTAKKTNRPLTEQEKQSRPMPGETSPAEAHMKARQFAQKVKSQMKNRS
jgi:hypothetical protein